MLLRLQVWNFKNLRDVTVRFGPMSCFVGPNGDRMAFSTIVSPVEGGWRDEKPFAKRRRVTNFVEGALPGPARKVRNRLSSDVARCSR